MKIKQTVAAVCLAAIMATSVGAAAEARTREPSHSEGVWDHGVESGCSYSYFQSKTQNWSWSCAANGKQFMRDDLMPYRSGKPAKSSVSRTPFGNRQWWDHWGSIK